MEPANSERRHEGFTSSCSGHGLSGRRQLWRWWRFAIRCQQRRHDRGNHGWNDWRHVGRNDDHSSLDKRGFGLGQQFHPAKYSNRGWNDGNVDVGVQCDGAQRDICRRRVGRSRRQRDLQQDVQCVGNIQLRLHVTWRDERLSAGEVGAVLQGRRRPCRALAVRASCHLRVFLS
jgi:hypothetical protein